MAMPSDEVRARLRDWLESNVNGWRNVNLRPMEILLGSGFSAEIFFVDVDYNDAGGPQSRTLVVRRQPTDFEVVLGSSLVLQGNMMATLDRLQVTPVPEWVGMELNPDVLDMPFLIMGRVEGQSATQRPNYNSAGWVADMSPTERGLTWRNAIEAFAKMSKIDWQQDGFGFWPMQTGARPGLTNISAILRLGIMVAARAVRCATSMLRWIIFASISHEVRQPMSCGGTARLQT